MTADEFLTTLWALLLALGRYNVTLTALGIAVALPIGSLLAVGRLSPRRWVYYGTTAYVNLLRSSPLLMVLFWTYYSAPMLVGANVSAFYAALIALSAFEAAYFAEFIRTGLQSIPRDQVLAALATGLRPWQVSAFVVWPQAVRRVMPSLLTQSIIAFQDSTLASIIGVREVVSMATIINARQVRPVWLYSMLAVAYLVLCFGLSRCVRRVERRIAVTLSA